MTSIRLVAIDLPPSCNASTDASSSTRSGLINRWIRLDIASRFHDAKDDRKEGGGRALPLARDRRRRLRTATTPSTGVTHRTTATQDDRSQAPRRRQPVSVTVRLRFQRGELSSGPPAAAVVRRRSRAVTRRAAAADLCKNRSHGDLTRLGAHHGSRERCRRVADASRGRTRAEPRRRRTMRWQMGRRSDNIEDRRGIGVGGVAVGGGIGTVVLVLVALFLGVDPSVVLQGGGPDISTAPPAVERRAPSPDEDRVKDFVAVVLADTEDTWRE